MVEIFDYKYVPEIVITKNDVEKYFVKAQLEERKAFLIEKIIEKDPSLLKKVINNRGVLAFENNNIYLVEVRSKKGYYKLKAVEKNVTTIEINGIHMHKVKDLNPLEDAKRKVKMARVKPREKVLDICTGLGYTAIMSMRRGALVTSIEVDENVLWVAERNPWSRELESKNIVIILGDAFEVVDELPSNFYDKIIHDPPRISKSSGILYSQDFYLKLFRLLKSGGVLYHYTGESGRLRRINIQGSVAARLKRVGFYIIKFDNVSGGIIAKKP